MFTYILEHKKDIIIALSKGISNIDEFKLACEYIINEKLTMFEIPEFTNKLYENEDDIVDLIFPAFRRVWGNIYTKPPSLFTNFKNDKRLELYQSLFNIDEFLEYFIEMIIKTKGCLNDFEYIDKTSQHLTLIVDSYIGMLFKRVTTSTDIKLDIRDARLNKLIK